MRTMFKETKQKCARDQRGARKAALPDTDKMPTKQKPDEGKVSFERVCPLMQIPTYQATAFAAVRLRQVCKD